MARTEAQTRQLFDEWAQSYDADLVNESGILLGYKASLSAISGVLPPAAGKKVLDIGIGSGAVAALFAQQGAQISGVDISQKMLDICRAQYPNFDLHVGTFTDIPAADQTFDYVVSGFAFHETPLANRADACVQMARVLKENGYLCLLDIMFASPAATQEAQQRIADYWDDSEDYALIGDLDALLRQSGFTSLKWYQTAPFHWMLTARKA